MLQEQQQQHQQQEEQEEEQKEEGVGMLGYQVDRSISSGKSALTRFHRVKLPSCQAAELSS